jgi:hypothetical protein
MLVLNEIMHMDKKIEIDITDDDHEWVERIGKTVYEICNEPTRLIPFCQSSVTM